MTAGTGALPVQNASAPAEESEPVTVPPEVTELLQPLANAYQWLHMLTTASNDAAEDVHRLARALAEAREASTFYSRLASSQERAISLRLHMLDAGVRAAGLPGRPPLPAAEPPDHGLPTPPPYSDPLNDPLGVLVEDETQPETDS